MDGRKECVQQQCPMCTLVGSGCWARLEGRKEWFCLQQRLHQLEHAELEGRSTVYSSELLHQLMQARMGADLQQQVYSSRLRPGLMWSTCC